GQQPLIIRRDVFDLLGPAARAAGVNQIPQFTDAQRLRRALLLLGQTQIFLQPCELPANFLAYQSASTDLKERALWMSALHGEIDNWTKLDAMFAKLSYRDRTTREVSAIREGITPPGGRSFIDRPNIIHHRRWLE